MVQLSQEAETLARRLAAAQGISMEEAIKQALESRVRVADDPHRTRRDTSAEAVAARKARIDQIVEDIAKMPVLDPRSPREIIDDLDAL